MSTPAPAVVARDLIKTYPGDVTALNGMDVTVEAGTVENEHPRRRQSPAEGDVRARGDSAGVTTLHRPARRPSASPKRSRVADAAGSAAAPFIVQGPAAESATVATGRRSDFWATDADGAAYAAGARTSRPATSPLGRVDPTGAGALHSTVPASTVTSMPFSAVTSPG